MCGGALLVFSDTGEGSCTTCRMVADDLQLRAQPRYFAAGYHVGWRMWHTLPPGAAPGRRRGLRSRADGEEIDMDAGALYSMNGTRWQPGVRMEAVCELGGAPPCPEEDADPAAYVCGTCGVYAAREYGQLAAYGLQQSSVVGRVALWGRLEEHERVWRAQYAYPLCFVGTSVTSPAATATLAEGWGVPLLGLLDALDMHEAEAA